MAKIRDILHEKGHAVWSVRPDESVYDALTLMAEKDIGAVLVLDEANNLIGVLSERDYARKVVLEGHSSRETRVSSIMSHPVFCVAPDTTVEEALRMMTDGHVRHLPVLQDGRLTGLISIGDVVKSIISDQGYLIDQLERYIAGA